MPSLYWYSPATTGFLGQVLFIYSRQPSPMPSLYWYGPAATGFLGLVLFIYGRRGRRRGIDPHCRKCDYNLTGLTSEKCPECGSIVAQVGIRRGARTRRAALTWVGLAILLLSGAGLTTSVVRWFRSLRCADMPTWWLLREAQHTDRSHGYSGSASPPGLEAYEELSVRQRNGRLSPDQSQKLVGIALNEFLAWSDLYRVGDSVEEAAREILARSVDRLTPAERRQVFESCAWVVWRTRPQAQLADGIPVDLEVAERFGASVKAEIESITVCAPDGATQTLTPLPPSLDYLPASETTTRFWGLVTVKSVILNSGNFRPRVDMPPPLGKGEDLPLRTYVYRDPAFDRRWTDHWKWVATPNREGTWEFECRVKLKICLMHDDSRPRPKPEFETVRVLTAKSQVFDWDRPDPVKLIDDPGLEAGIASRIGASLKLDKKRPKEIQADMMIKGFPLPVDLAFDVEYEIDGKRFPAPPMVVKRDRPPSTDIVYGQWSPLDSRDTHQVGSSWLPNSKGARKISLILTPNPALARKTVDIFEIWSKPIRKELEIPEKPVSPI